MRRIEIAENDRAGRLEMLSQNTAAALATTRLVDVRPEGADHWRLLPLTSVVGAVRVSDVDVVVRPKAPFASVLFMLGYARDPGLAPDQFRGAVDDDPWSLVAETLARLAHAALLRGALQGYVTRDDALTVIRGRLLIADQIARHPGLLIPAEVRFDEYDVDIPENRILRTALHRVALVPRLRMDLRRRLTHLAARLQGASLLTPGVPLPAWRPTRLNERYVPALRLAQVVLRHLGLATTAGDQAVASFVVNMATVFEDFLTTALTESLAHTSAGRTVGQFPAHLDDADRVDIRPDVVHVVDGKPLAVLDAKYKLGDDSGSYPTADLYQMHAYCTVLGLRRGFLVYAGSKAERLTVVEHRVRGAEVALVTWPLDVSVSPGQLLRGVADVARSAVPHAASTGSPAPLATPVAGT
jgi:5-methylcytosine-specific restriction enzyme subunit McrC